MCRSAAARTSTAASTVRAASARSPIRSTLVCGNSRAAAEAARLFGVCAMPVHTVGTSPAAQARLVECAGLAGPGPSGAGPAVVAAAEAGLVEPAGPVLGAAGYAGAAVVVVCGGWGRRTRRVGCVSGCGPEVV